jgi:CYTH domain-containing protein
MERRAFLPVSPQRSVLTNRCTSKIPEVGPRRLPNPSFLRKNGEMQQHKYARVERERRFLLGQFPSGANIVRARRISDRYIDGTSLRLREQIDDSGPPTYKLTQKIPERSSGAQQGLITSMILSRDEFLVLTRLPARELSKMRFSMPPFGIDVFEGALEGLFLAEAEFDSAATADALELPSFILREISADDRFTGGRLVRTSRQELRDWLSDYELTLNDQR